MKTQLPQTKFTNFRIQNVVGSTDVGFAIRLEGLASDHEAYCSVCRFKLNHSTRCCSLSLALALSLSLFLSRSLSLSRARALSLYLSLSLSLPPAI
jgi:hypothetical protein